MYGDGSVTGTINGLQNLVNQSPTSGVVGGIDRAVWTFWRNFYFQATAAAGTNGGGAAATAANIQHYMNVVYTNIVRGRDRPDLIVADNAFWRLYLESLQAIQRITTTDTTPDMAEIGFDSVKYMNADVVLDGGFQGFSTDPFAADFSGGTAVGGAPANSMYFLNTRFIHWRPHADRDMVPLDPKRFSVNQDAMVSLLGWAGNMTLSNAFLQGVLFN